MTKEALLASQAAICVAQFMKQPNHEAKLKELEAVSSWQRAEVIEKGGWDKMPGHEKAGYAVSFAAHVLKDVGLRPTAFSMSAASRAQMTRIERSME
jgi:hypothetical protein